MCFSKPFTFICGKLSDKFLQNCLNFRRASSEFVSLTTSAGKGIPKSVAAEVGPNAASRAVVAGGKCIAAAVAPSVDVPEATADEEDRRGPTAGGCDNLATSAVVSEEAPNATPSEDTLAAAGDDRGGSVVDGGNSLAASAPVISAEEGATTAAAAAAADIGTDTAPTDAEYGLGVVVADPPSGDDAPTAENDRVAISNVGRGLTDVVSTSLSVGGLWAATGAMPLS